MCPSSGENLLNDLCDSENLQTEASIQLLCFQGVKIKTT